MTKPLVQYLFENNANDSSGNGYNGTPANLTYQDAPEDKNFEGKVAVFNGSSSKISLPAMPIFNGGSYNITIETWFYTPINKTARIFCTWRSGSGGGSGFIVQTGSNGYIQFDPVGGGINIVKYTTNTWQHLVVTYNGTGNTNGLICYLDGQSTAVTVSRSLNFINENRAIGYEPYYNAEYYGGRLANFRIYNSVLTPNEILEHYQTESSPPPDALYRLVPRRSRELGYVLQQAR